jgi:hypothetical protein
MRTLAASATEALQLLLKHRPLRVAKPQHRRQLMLLP